MFSFTLFTALEVIQVKNPEVNKYVIIILGTLAGIILLIAGTIVAVRIKYGVSIFTLIAYIRSWKMG